MFILSTPILFDVLIIADARRSGKYLAQDLCTKHFLLQANVALFHGIHHKLKQRSLKDGRKVFAVCLLRVVLLDQLQRLLQLEHGGKAVLAGITTGAGAGQPAYLPCPVCKFHLVVLFAGDHGIARFAVNAEVLHPVFHVVRKAPIRDSLGDLHTGDGQLRSPPGAWCRKSHQSPASSPEGKPAPRRSGCAGTPFPVHAKRRGPWRQTAPGFPHRMCPPHGSRSTPPAPPGAGT